MGRAPQPHQQKNPIRFGYKISSKHIVYSDQCLGAVPPIVYKIVEKIIKVCTVMLFSMMTITCKIIAMFTIIMGTVVFKCSPLIYGWMSTYNALVTGGLIVVVKFSYSLQWFLPTIFLPGRGIPPAER